MEIGRRVAGVRIEGEYGGEMEYGDKCRVESV